MHNKVLDYGTAAWTFPQEGDFIDSAATANEIDLVTIQGPQLDKEDLPEKLRDFCPDGFEVFTARQVRIDPEEDAMADYYNATQFTLEDPLIQQRDLAFGEPQSLTILISA